MIATAGQYCCSMKRRQIAAWLSSGLASVQSPLEAIQPEFLASSLLLPTFVEEVIHYGRNGIDDGATSCPDDVPSKQPAFVTTFPEVHLIFSPPSALKILLILIFFINIDSVDSPDALVPRKSTVFFAGSSNVFWTIGSAVSIFMPSLDEISFRQKLE